MSKFNIGNMNLYYGDFHALKDINMEIQANEITAFIGPSGCGKSTFLKSLNRMNDLVDGCRITGKIELDGEDIYGNIDEIISLFDGDETVNLEIEGIQILNDKIYIGMSAKKQEQRSYAFIYSIQRSDI